MKLRNPHVQEGGIANGIIAGGTHIVVILISFLKLVVIFLDFPKKILTLGHKTYVGPPT